VQDRVLAPGDIELDFVERHRVERSVDDRDPVPQPRFAGQLPVAFILDARKIEAGDAGAIFARQHARRAAETGAEIQHMLALDAAEMLRHAIDGRPARLADVAAFLVNADMDILAAPDGGVEIVGFLAVIIVARGGDARAGRLRHRHSSSPRDG
jgi:hypothetical protein